MYIDLTQSTQGGKLGDYRGLIQSFRSATLVDSQDIDIRASVYEDNTVIVTKDEEDVVSHVIMLDDIADKVVREVGIFQRANGICDLQIEVDNLWVEG